MKKIGTLLLSIILLTTVFVLPSSACTIYREFLSSDVRYVHTIMSTCHLIYTQAIDIDNAPSTTTAFDYYNCNSGATYYQHSGTVRKGYGTTKVNPCM